MRKKEILLVIKVTAINLVLMVFYLVLDIISIFGFCKNCGTRVRAWEIIAFNLFGHPMHIYTSKELHDTGISLFLGRCEENCDISIFSSIKYGLFGKKRNSNPGFSELKLLIEDSDTKLLCEFLSEYEKTQDFNIRNKLKESLRESLHGKTEPWQKELHEAWEGYKIKHLLPDVNSHG